MTPAAVVLLAAISGTAGAFTPVRVGEAPLETTASRARGALARGPRRTEQRVADRLLARRVRGVIRADRSLALAAPGVKVTSNRGIVRLVGRVRTDKERSSIAFKAGQMARVGGIDDRVTVGVEATAPQTATLAGILVVLLGTAGILDIVRRRFRFPPFRAAWRRPSDPGTPRAVTGQLLDAGDAVVASATMTCVVR